MAKPTRNEDTRRWVITDTTQARRARYLVDTEEAALRGPRPAPDPLYYLTVSHVILGYMVFRASLCLEPDLTLRILDRSQVAAMERMQIALDRGRIGYAAFARAIRSRIGDVTPRRAFVGFAAWGTPVLPAPVSRLPAVLGLDDEQQRICESILARCHHEIAEQREHTIAALRDILSGSQQSRLSHLDFLAPVRAGARLKTVDGRTCFDRLVDELDMTGEQQAAFSVRNGLLRFEVAARHHRARVGFIGLLSMAQRKQLTRMERGDL